MPDINTLLDGQTIRIVEANPHRILFELDDMGGPYTNKFFVVEPNDRDEPVPSLKVSRLKMEELN